MENSVLFPSGEPATIDGYGLGAESTLTLWMRGGRLLLNPELEPTTPRSTPQWGAVDAEIKNPTSPACDVSPGLSKVPSIKLLSFI